MNKMNIIDMHCDTLLEMHTKGRGLRELDGHINLDKLRCGGSMLQCFAVYTPTHGEAESCRITSGPWEYFNAAADIFEREMEANREYIRPVRSMAEIRANAGAGIISAMLTLEDGVCIDGRHERVQRLYDRGVRMIALTWNYENSIGYPNSFDPEAHAMGLKPFGAETVEQMKRLGMIVDVSHLSEGGFRDVADILKGPFVASHSCARALCDHSRNLTDEQLRTLGDCGGVCGVNFLSRFLVRDAAYTRIDDILRHMEHIADKAGTEAVALGSDFDGIDCGLELGDFAGMTRLTEKIAARFGSDRADKICHGNALRVMGEVIG